MLFLKPQAFTPRRVCLQRAWLVALGLLAATCAPATPQKRGPSVSVPDANAIVRQMVATYQRATTIQETSVANFEEFHGIALSQANTLKFQRPNLLAEISQD